MQWDMTLSRGDVLFRFSGKHGGVRVRVSSREGQLPPILRLSKSSLVAQPARKAWGPNSRPHLLLLLTPPLAPIGSASGLPILCVLPSGVSAIQVFTDLDCRQNTTENSRQCLRFVTLSRGRQENPSGWSSWSTDVSNSLYCC